MHTVHSECYIQADPAIVWKVLLDFERYPDWNPFIRQIQGQAVQGAKLRVQINSPMGGTQGFRPRVTRFQEHSILEWRGRVLLPGIFDGTHRFVLERKSDGSTLLTHAEDFSGVLAPWLLRRMGSGLKTAFAAMNSALKQRAEELATTQVLAKPAPRNTNN